MDTIWRETARKKEQEARRLRVALRQVQHTLEQEKKQKRRDLLTVERVQELKGRVDALACANFFLRQQLQCMFIHPKTED